MRSILLLLWFFLLSSGCGFSSTASVTSTGCTSHQIPGDPTSLYAAFHASDSRYDFVVLTYGKQMEDDFGGVTVDGNKIDVPKDGGVYVLDSNLKLHKTSVAANDLQKLLWTGSPDDLLESQVWQNELYPLLKQHPWNGGR